MGKYRFSITVAETATPKLSPSRLTSPNSIPASVKPQQKEQFSPSGSISSRKQITDLASLRSKAHTNSTLRQQQKPTSSCLATSTNQVSSSQAFWSLSCPFTDGNIRGRGRSIPNKPHSSFANGTRMYLRGGLALKVHGHCITKAAGGRGGKLTPPPQPPSQL